MMLLGKLGAGLGVLTTAMLLAQPALAQGRWELLGTRQVGFQVERDSIGARGEGRFSVVRLCVANNTVHLRDVDVVFENGQRQQLAVNTRLRPGQCTANLDLRGAARRIAQVHLVYNSVPNFRGRATVSVYGLHTRMGPGPGQPGNRPGSWDVMGRKTVGFQTERESIGARGEGRFRALRLCVTRAPVRFREIEIVYGNGMRQRMPVNRHVGPGQCTSAFNLPGDERRIREVVMIYRAIPNYRGQAVVTLYGQR